MAECPRCGKQDIEGGQNCPSCQAPTVVLPGGAAPVVDLPAGTMLEGVYRVAERIGRGGVGAVYLVEHVELGKHFAAKVLAPLAAADDESVQRLRNEARAASAIDHENIVGVSHLGRTPNGSVFVVMELLQGEDLAARLGRQRLGAGPAYLPDDECREIGRQMLAGLDAAHRVGIVHRDLKPGNVFLSRRGERMVVKLVDFGLSKLHLATSDARLTRDGQVFGTPLYMAPEQARSAGEVDHRADLYSMGVILYEMVTGRVPFDAPSIAECLVKHAVEPPPSPRSLRPDLSVAVEALLLHCLAKSPADRPSSARELLGAWEAAWEQSVSASVAGGAGAAPASGPAAVAADASSSLDPTPPSDPAPVAAARTPSPSASARPVRRSRALAVLALAIAATLGFGYAVSRPPARDGARAGANRGARPDGARAVSPLADADAVLACPLLGTAGVDEPSGWLGAAAAAMACERARVLLGGRHERILVPAELLDLPRAPSDSFPLDPFTSRGDRDRSLRAARERGAAVLDGQVARHGQGFRVSLRLSDREGREHGEGAADGRSLLEAVRAAMVPLVEGGALPKAERLDPVVAEWSRATSVDAALALADVRISQRQMARTHEEECTRLERYRAELREAFPLYRSICSHQLGRQEPDDAPIRVDFGSGPVLVATSLRTQVAGPDPAADPARIAAELDRYRRAEKTALGRAILSSALSCSLPSEEGRRARDLSVLATGASPKVTEVLPCEPWYQNLYVSQFSGTAFGALRAWTPWHAEAWMAVDPGPRALEYTLRAFLLAPMRTPIAEALVDRYLEGGRPADARTAALTLVEGSAVQRLAGQTSLARIEAGEARFAASLELSREAVRHHEGDAGYLHGQRWTASLQAIQVARIVERQADWADLVWERFIEPDPIPTGILLNPRARLWFAAACLEASAPKRAPCFARVHAVERAGGFSTDVPDAAAFTAGAEHLSKGDRRRAADAWRPLVRTSVPILEILRDDMAELFDGLGETELAERVDAPALAAGEFNGVNLAFVRAALRAERAGDHARAAALARKVVDAWAVADTTVPAVAAMRALLARLPR